jgi:hypothetical protein
MPKLKLSDDLKKLLDTFITEKRLASEHTNAKNRATTALRNHFKENVQTKQWPLGTQVAYGGSLIEYKPTDRTEILPEDFYKMLEDGEITKEQFLKCISVRKSDVATHVGSDVLLTLETPTEGDKYDIRVSDMPADDAKHEYVLVPVATGAIKRKKLGKKAATSDSSKAKIRSIKVKRNT